jgi:hypothetical protein
VQGMAGSMRYRLKRMVILLLFKKCVVRVKSGFNKYLVISSLKLKAPNPMIHEHK